MNEKTKTTNLKVGEYPNYKTLCEVLEEDIKTGNSKKAQFNRWAQSFKFTQQGHKFIVEEIYSNLIPVKVEKKMTLDEKIDITNLQEFTVYKNYATLCRVLNIKPSTRRREQKEKLSQYFEFIEDRKEGKIFIGEIYEFPRYNFKDLSGKFVPDMVNLILYYIHQCKEKTTSKTNWYINLGMCNEMFKELKYLTPQQLPDNEIMKMTVEEYQSIEYYNYIRNIAIDTLGTKMNNILMYALKVLEAKRIIHTEQSFIIQPTEGASFLVDRKWVPNLLAIQNTVLREMGVSNIYNLFGKYDKYYHLCNKKLQSLYPEWKYFYEVLTVCEASNVPELLEELDFEEAKRTLRKNMFISLEEGYVNRNINALRKEIESTNAKINLSPEQKQRIIESLEEELNSLNFTSFLVEGLNIKNYYTAEVLESAKKVTQGLLDLN